VATTQHQRPAIWRNATVLKWGAQILVLVGLIFLFITLGAQSIENFADRGLSYSYRFLSDPTGFTVREGIAFDPDTGARALYVGIVNTLRITISGIIVATLLGTIVGVSRLSNNWIINKIATVYIETIRNIPLIVQIIFWGAIIQQLPALVDEDVGLYTFFFGSAKGITVPWLFPDSGFYQWLVFVIIGLIAGRFVYKWRMRIKEDEGRETYAISWGVASIVLISLIGWFAHPIFAFLGPVANAIGDGIGAIPSLLVRIALLGLVVAGVATWIMRFFRNNRAGDAPALNNTAVFGIFAVALVASLLLVGALLSFVDREQGVAFWLGLGVVLAIIVVAIKFLIDFVAPRTLVAGLVDDDYFRVIFAVIAGIVMIGVFVGIEAISETIINLFSAFFHFLGPKFDAANTAAPFSYAPPAVEVRGAGFVQLSNESLVITPGFFALWVGVTLYTASFIAEIVRGGVLAVSRGQSEAGNALGLSRFQLYRFIVLPQAFRIVLPPIGNQYLNLFKNTSLGIAVAFSDIVQVGQTLYNQTGQTVPVVSLWMAFYLTGSLVLSSIVNYANRRLKLVER
jgi:His/Glu/Gln/Arg/opine family amino acid ABC transporter permease subunit